jgi:hypothetical protein
MKIGLDLHGVIDTNPEFFSQFAKLFIDNGHEVHILSGPQEHRLREQLKQLNMPYTHLFSIVDWALDNGHNVIFDENKNGTIESYMWDRAKAEYAAKHKLDIHFDDSDIYSYFFKTPYARYLSKDTNRVKKIKI